MSRISLAMGMALGICFSSLYSRYRYLSHELPVGRAAPLQPVTVTHFTDLELRSESGMTRPAHLMHEYNMTTLRLPTPAQPQRRHGDFIGPVYLDYVT
jgi:hypothetical protein